MPFEEIYEYTFNGLFLTGRVPKMVELMCQTIFVSVNLARRFLGHTLDK